MLYSHDAQDLGFSFNNLFLKVAYVPFDLDCPADTGI